MATLLSPAPENIALLAAKLRAGELVAFATETVYGLGADATNADAVARIYAAKNRPQFNPLIAHYATLASLQRDVLWNDDADKLAAAFWPGPLTLVLPKAPQCRICSLATAGLDTAAVRMPRHPAARALLEAAAIPVVAPSANPSGRLSPVRAEHVQAWLGDKIDWILDGGPAEEGLESAVIDLSGPCPALLRHGTLGWERLREVLPDLQWAETSGDSVAKSPGLLLKHYAPRKPLRIATDNPRPGEALLAFGPAPLPAGFTVIYHLSEKGDAAEAARHLFDLLHQLDAREDITGIAAMLLPETGLGRAVNDRLRRAAETYSLG